MKYTALLKKLQIYLIIGFLTGLCIIFFQLRNLSITIQIITITIYVISIPLLILMIFKIVSKNTGE